MCILEKAVCCFSLFLRQERELEFPIGHIAHFGCTQGFAFEYRLNCLPSPRPITPDALKLIVNWLLQKHVRAMPWGSPKPFLGRWANWNSAKFKADLQCLGRIYIFFSALTVFWLIIVMACVSFCSTCYISEFCSQRALERSSPFRCGFNFLLHLVSFLQDAIFARVGVLARAVGVAGLSLLVHHALAVGEGV